MKVLSESELQRKVGEFVDREVIYCVSHLVTDLSNIEQDNEQILELWKGPPVEDEEDEYEEVFEHWIVSDWLADKLIAKGETVVKDFHGLTIWGRCCSGQAILLDYVIRDIYLRLQEGCHEG